MGHRAWLYSLIVALYSLTASASIHVRVHEWSIYLFCLRKLLCESNNQFVYFITFEPRMNIWRQ